MAGSYSKQVLDRSGSTDKILASLATLGPEVAAAIAAELSPCLEPGEQMPDFGLVLTLIGRHVDRQRKRLNESDENHQTELSDDDTHRNARDAADAALGNRLVKTRELVRALFSAEGEKAVGFVGPTPAQPRARVRLARTVAERLSGLAGELPEGIIFAADPHVAALRVEADVLEGHVAQVDLEEREAQGTLVKRDAEQSRFDSTFSTDGGLVSGFYKLGGQPEHARRLNPSSRRPGLTAEDAGEVEPEAEG